MPPRERNFGEPEFLGWALLRELKNRRNDQISRSKFLKLCCIADRRMIEVYNYSVGLPRYWYMYGELTNEHEFSGRFYNAPQAIGWDGQQYIPKKLAVDDFDVSNEGLKLILQAVKWTAREFGAKNVEEIKQYQYEEHSENQFIKEYSELRWLLSEIDLGRQERLQKYVEGESNEEYLHRKLDDMIDTYPDDEDRYDELRALYLRWDDTVRLMQEQSVEYSRIAEFLDEFIRTLSKAVLRFNYNQSISAKRLADWEEDASVEVSEFTTHLREVREELLIGRSRSTELDQVSDVYSQTVEEQIEELVAQK